MQDPYLPPDSRLSSVGAEENREVAQNPIACFFWWLYLGVSVLLWCSSIWQSFSSGEGGLGKVWWVSILLGWIPLLGLLGYILKRRFLVAWVWELTCCLVLVGILWNMRAVLNDLETAVFVALNVPMAYAMWFYQDLFKS
ncbi:MAG: hypothetical protein ACRDD3_00205 [Azovibrio sp.]